jgi:hypothetical protein
MQVRKFLFIKTEILTSWKSLVEKIIGIELISTLLDSFHRH